MIVNEARAQADSSVILAEAEASTFENYTVVQAAAYGDLKSNLSLANPELIQYLRNQMVKNYPTGNFQISIKGGL